MENWRRYTSQEKIILEATKLLQEQGINPCNIPDFNNLLIKAVENPKNKRVFNALRKAIFGVHKKSKLNQKDASEEASLSEGTITIANASQFDIYDIEVIAMAGPDAKINLNADGAILYDQSYDPKKDESIPIQDQFPGAPKDIKAGTSKTFKAQEGWYAFAFRWFPERIYVSPGEPTAEAAQYFEDAKEAPTNRGVFSVQRVGTSPEKGHIRYMNPSYILNFVDNPKPLGAEINHRYTLTTMNVDEDFIDQAPGFGGRGSFVITEK